MAPPADGPLLFARYAYPPNELGYCGGDDHRALLEQTSAGVVDGGLRQRLREFEGAWPYLELIAAANQLDDPLDARVVEAYWLGSGLLDKVGPALLASSLDERFRRRAGRSWTALADAIPHGALPHHSFHVLGVYPFVGLIRSGTVAEPLHVLDRCRIRWGRVVAVIGDRAVVRSRPLEWDGHRLVLGAVRDEEAVTGEGTLRLGRALAAGDWCSLHWDWVCDRLEPGQVRALQHYTESQIIAVNNAPATVLA
ncbi:MAG TPA: DUF6390 family protein [Dermatophilaceae bacterium]|jgi:Family of unknown function (DUF6390)